jgi:hypothetical protein
MPHRGLLVLGQCGVDEQAFHALHGDFKCRQVVVVRLHNVGAGKVAAQGFAALFTAAGQTKPDLRCFALKKARQRAAECAGCTEDQDAAWNGFAVVGDRHDVTR